MRRAKAIKSLSFILFFCPCSDKLLKFIALMACNIRTGSANVPSFNIKVVCCVLFGKTAYVQACLNEI